VARIVIVLNASWNVWNFRLPLLSSLEQDGHQIEVIAPRDNYTERIPYPCHHIDIQSKSTNPVVDMRICFNMWFLFRKIKPDIALLYTVKPNIYGNLAARLARVRAVSNIAGLGSVFNETGPLVILVKWLYRISLRGAVRVFFQNQEDRDQFVSEKLVDPKIADVLPGSGVDLCRFTPLMEGKKERDSESNKPYIFLLPSRMLWEKGIKEYVEAGKRLIARGYNVELRLVGFLDVDNPNAITREQMEKLTVVPGIRYLGVSDRIEDEISKVDCVVLPSYYREGTPRVLLEAAAMAKPVVTTDTPGCRDVVEDGVTGHLCRPEDSDDLYDKMKLMLELSVASRGDMGDKGRSKMVREYDQDIVIRTYKAAVDKILGE
jgi:glycosyltransferase involved in cell wall biosynthesis